MKDRAHSAGHPASYLPYVLLSLVLAVVFSIRIRLLAVPLERDEGEFAYIGQLLLKGIAPYSHAYTMKLPGPGGAYALFMAAFGQTPAGIHLGLLIVNGICIYLLYLLAKRLFDGKAALYSCAGYALLSLSSSVNGLFAHATHFVVLFALAGFLTLLSALEREQRSRLFVSGLFFGIAVTMKQHALLLALYAFLYFQLRAATGPGSVKNRLTGGFLLALGALLPYALILVWMAASGNFGQFWLWTVQYAGEYASGSTLKQGLANFTDSFGIILKTQWPLWFLAGFGCAALARNKRGCSDRVFVFGFLLFSLLSICPGMYFRGHYFVLLLPAVALLIGSGTRSAELMLSAPNFAPWAACCALLPLVLAISYGFFQEKDCFFILTPTQVSRATYGANPFAEAPRIAGYLKGHTSPTDRIAVFGSEPEIYFYADRLSATGHIYMYGLMENQPFAERMQAQMIGDIEAARPKYIVTVNVSSSWLVQKSSLRSVLYWGERYLTESYDPVGIIDIIDADTTRYLWDDQAAGYTPISQNFVTVFKRKNP